MNRVSEEDRNGHSFLHYKVDFKKQQKETTKAIYVNEKVSSTF